MKLITNVNRLDTKSGSGSDPSPVADACGLKIASRQSGVYDYEAFLVAKGLNNIGLGALIKPEDYFDPSKSKDVYIFLCARPESVPVSDQFSVDMYPIFFIAHVAGMSDPFSMPGETGQCHTVCLDAVQRVGVGDTLAGIQSRIYMNLHIKRAPELSGQSMILFRPSWDRFLSSPDAAFKYESEVCPVEWSITQDNDIDLVVKNKDGGNLHGPWLYTCWSHQAGAVKMTPSDIRAQSNWSIWCGEFGSVDRDQYFAIADFAANMSFPFAKTAHSEKPFIQNTVWMCWMASLDEPGGILPTAHVPGTNAFGDVQDPGLSVIFPVVRGR